MCAETIDTLYPILSTNFDAIVESTKKHDVYLTQAYGDKDNELGQPVEVDPTDKATTTY